MIIIIIIVIKDLIGQKIINSPHWRIGPLIWSTEFISEYIERFNSFIVSGPAAEVAVLPFILFWHQHISRNYIPEIMSSIYGCLYVWWYMLVSFVSYITWFLVLLVHLSRHQRVSRKLIPHSWAPRRESHNYHVYSLWYDMTRQRIKGVKK